MKNIISLSISILFDFMNNKKIYYFEILIFDMNMNDIISRLEENREIEIDLNVLYRLFNDQIFKKIDRFITQNLNN